MHSALRELEEWLIGLRETGYRGLVLLHSSTLSTALDVVSDRLNTFYSNVTCIAPRELRQKASRDRCAHWLSPSAIERLLGTDNEAVVIAVPRLLRPNLVAAAAETVVRGGVLVILAPMLSDWEPGGEMTTSNYKRYLIKRLYGSKSVFWACLDTDTVYLARLPTRYTQQEKKEEYRPRSHVSRELLRLARSTDQAKGLDELVYHFRTMHGRGAFIVGDRGRGKSGLLGLFTAYLINSHMVGFLPVTAPSPWSIQSFFNVLLHALSHLGVRRVKVLRQSDLVIGINGPWFRIRYLPPDRMETGSFTIIDEGAALGPLRLRLIAAKAPRLLIATTIHGYEGSGRVLAKIVEDIVPAPRIKVELSTPIRYLPGDPLEEWIYTTFMLRTEPRKPPRELDTSKLELRVVQRERLVEDEELLEKIYSILVLAHYRNEPDDLALILDAPHHILFAAIIGKEVVAVADASRESGNAPYEARIMPDLLATSKPEALHLSGLRIVRIAVHPNLQRKGIGSKLLSFIEDYAASMSLDWVGASFGQPDVVRFWLRNGYLVAYVSPLPSKATGEHNIAVIKPLNNVSEKILIAVAKDMVRRLLLAGHTLYRGVPAEIMATLLEGDKKLSQKPLAELSPEQLHRVKLVLSHQLDVEAALDAYWLLLVNTALGNGGLGLLDRDERVVAIARVIQGKSLRDLIALTNKDAETVKMLLYSALEKLIENTAIDLFNGTTNRGSDNKRMSEAKQE